MTRPWHQARLTRITRSSRGQRLPVVSESSRLAGASTRSVEIRVAELLKVEVEGSFCKLQLSDQPAAACVY